MENKGFWRKLFRKEKNTEINNKGPNQTWMNSEKCENGHWYDNSVYGSDLATCYGHMRQVC